MTKKSSVKTEEMLFAGFGGQGIMFLGKLLAETGLLAGLNVTWMPSYGAEVRGGTAYSMVKISEHPIASPVVLKPDILVVMNKPSLVKYASSVKEGGIIVSNKSLIDEKVSRKDVKIINFPFTDIASKLGNTKCANMVAAGVVVNHSKFITLRNVLAVLKDMLQSREDLFTLNKLAIEKGYKL